MISVSCKNNFQSGFTRSDCLGISVFRSQDNLELGFWDRKTTAKTCWKRSLISQSKLWLSEVTNHFVFAEKIVDLKAIILSQFFSLLTEALLVFSWYVCRKTQMWGVPKADGNMTHSIKIKPVNEFWKREMSSNQFYFIKISCCHLYE